MFHSVLRLSRYGRAALARKLLPAFVAISCLSAPLDAEEITIAALGDSLVQGYGLPADQGLVPRLQAWLDAQGLDVALVNAGVSGDTSAGGLARVDWTLTPEVDALVVALGGNDLLRGLDPAVTRANLDGILARARDRGLPVLLVAIDAPGNFGADYKAAFDGLFPELAETYGASLYPGFFAALRRDGDQAAQALLQGDGIHPNAEGVRRIVEDFGPAVADLARQVSPPS
jgi:acyl-CoA thioesterase-1